MMRFAGWWKKTAVLVLLGAAPGGCNLVFDYTATTNDLGRRTEASVLADAAAPVDGAGRPIDVERIRDKSGSSDTLVDQGGAQDAAAEQPSTASDSAPLEASTGGDVRNYPETGTVLPGDTCDNPIELYCASSTPVQVDVDTNGMNIDDPINCASSFHPEVYYRVINNSASSCQVNYIYNDSDASVFYWNLNDDPCVDSPINTSNCRPAAQPVMPGESLVFAVRAAYGAGFSFSYELY